MAKKYLDENGLLYVWGKIKAAMPTKLSELTNDDHTVKDANYVHTDNNFTTTEKNKLSNIASGAQANVIETIKVNNSALTPSSKTVNIEVPTKTSDLTNDSNFASDANYVHTDNNYTTTEKNKLNGIAANAQVNKLESVKVNGVTQTITSKAVDISVPTKTSDLTNDSNFASDSAYVHTDNNYTTTEKNKLSGIAANAQVNVIESVKVNGTALTPSSKAVNITVPTNTNQLTNGAGFQTASQVTTAINNALSDMTGIKFEIVQALPTTGIVGTIYLVPSTKTSAQNVYDEYFWVASTNKFEFMGTTAPDLTGYLKDTDVVAITNGEIDTICV